MISRKDVLFSYEYFPIDWNEALKISRKLNLKYIDFNGYIFSTEESSLDYNNYICTREDLVD